jgi:hypothetical protein
MKKINIQALNRFYRSSKYTDQIKYIVENAVSAYTESFNYDGILKLNVIQFKILEDLNLLEEFKKIEEKVETTPIFVETQKALDTSNAYIETISKYTEYLAANLDVVIQRVENVEKVLSKTGGFVLKVRGNTSKNS